MCVIFDVVLNIYWMKWWAGGNILLLQKTAYIVLQTISVTPVIFEVGFIIRHTKFFRFMSFAAAVTFIFSNLIWLIGFVA